MDIKKMVSTFQSSKEKSIETNFWRSVERLIARLSDGLTNGEVGVLPDPVKAYMVGGSAFHYYTQRRTSKDVDLAFSHRIIIPDGMTEVFHDEEETDLNKQSKLVTLDKNFHDALGLMHPDYKEDAVFIRAMGDTKNIELYIVSPLDLAVSKLARYAEQDESDIKILAGMDLFTKKAFRQRATEAMDYYIGDKGLMTYAVNEICQYMDKLDKANDYTP